MEASEKPIPNQRIGLPRDASTESIWQQGIEQPVPTIPVAFDSNLVYDVLIIGAGITGLTTALLLQEEGKNCVLAEAYSIGYGTTGGTTAHLNTYVDNTYDQIEKDFGEEGAKLVADATKEAISLVEELVLLHQIQCDFHYRQGFVYAETDQQANQLDEIFKASVKAGVSVHSTDRIPVPVSFKKAIVFEGQAQIHPLKYVTGLAKEFTRKGGIILENTRIRDIKKENNYNVGVSDSSSIKASKIVYATHIPPGINLLHFRNAPYRSYALGIRLPEEKLPDDLVYDLQDPYHYFRTQVKEGEKYLIIGGEDHKTGHGDPEASFRRLESYTKSLYPNCSIDYSWSAQYYEPSDGLPYIGKLPGFSEGVYVATGFGGNGITYGSIAGKILRDLVLDQPNKYENIFNPGRIKPVAGFSEFVKENVDVAFKFIADRISSTEIISIQEIETDKGVVVDFNDKKLAVYRDAGGEFHALNPVCTHAGCIVNWNPSEKSWDCPCHGARYDINGDVLTGPASKGLQKIDMNKV
jgi:glycine/D-amino acid oxidase-like deaminating enzyme/nitrite reductase/ring-hydroxylating ferredoxin subunit